MNCKPGDLAIVVSLSRLEKTAHQQAIGRFLIGKVVRVTHLFDAESWAIAEPIDVRGVCWAEGGSMHIMTGGVAESIPDSMLRPIRGLPVDESVNKDIEVTA